MRSTIVCAGWKYYPAEGFESSWRKTFNWTSLIKATSVNADAKGFAPTPRGNFRSRTLAASEKIEYSVHIRDHPW
jgi:hypothetical protein